jgi:hypothetical protein
MRTMSNWSTPTEPNSGAEEPSTPDAPVVDVDITNNPAPESEDVESEDSEDEDNGDVEGTEEVPPPGSP